MNQPLQEPARARRWLGNRCGPVTVRSISPSAQRGIVAVGPLRFGCDLGRTGRRAIKREGDGATPRGIWHAVQVLYRADRVMRPRCALPVAPLRPGDGWCDWPADRNYNRLVQHPYPASAEELWRADHLYDIIVILDHNQRPRVRGHGSAVFIHLSRSDRGPTAGCIALGMRDLRLLLMSLTSRTAIVIGV